MDIKKFIHMYGKHNVRVMDAKLPGDEAYTWLSADCNELGWLKVPKSWHYTEYAGDMVEVRRKDATAYAVDIAGIRRKETAMLSTPTNTNDQLAIPGQIHAIDEMCAKHKMLYGVMCYKAFGRTIDEAELTVAEAKAVLDAGREIIKRRKELWES